MQRSRQLYRRVLDLGERSAYGQATSKALYGDAALDTEEGNYKQATEQNRGYPRLASLKAGIAAILFSSRCWGHCCHIDALYRNRTYAVAMNFLDFGRFLAGTAREKSSNCVSPKEFRGE